MAAVEVHNLRKEFIRKDATMEGMGQLKPSFEGLGAVVSGSCSPASIPDAPVGSSSFSSTRSAWRSGTWTW